MNYYLNLVFVIALISLFPPALFGVEKRASAKPSVESLNTTATYSRLCQEEDLYGLWKVVRWIPYFEISGKDWNKPAFLKNQWFLFDGKGGMKSLASNMEMKLDDVKRKLSDSNSNISISFKRKGFMDVAYEDKNFPVEHWRCSVAEKNLIIKSVNTELKKGDLIMTMLGKDNTIKYFRQLRRVEN
jgi:hypothetical protein